jgi:diacylglycerol O-acyltransferase / wax synthase
MARNAVGNGEQHPYLSQNDTIMWTVESDPLLRSTIVGVAVLDQPPAWDDVVARVQHAVAMVPEMRRVVVDAPLHNATLRWVDDMNFDLPYHLRRMQLPGEATLQDVLDVARTMAMSRFDLARPLWEFTMVEGLEGGRAAFIMKAHHVLTDGIGSLQLAVHLFDLERDAEPRPDPDVAPPKRMSRLELWRDALGHDVETALAVGLKHAAAFPDQVMSTLAHPLRTASDIAETAASVGRTIAPTLSRLSPVMKDRMLATSFRTFDVPLQEMRDSGHAAGGSHNDAFLAGITGGLRRYHELHGASVPELRVAMPISLRTEGDKEGGNHVTVLRFVVPVSTEDPVERMRELHAIGLRIRKERSLQHTEAIAGFLNLMPSGVIGSMLEKVDFLASNVPGVGAPLYFAGSQIEAIVPFGPTAGSSMNVTLMSYRDLCHVGVDTDNAAVPDPDTMLACLRAGFDEVLAVAQAPSATTGRGRTRSPRRK